MDTRTEVINGYTYCAYCGKELENPHVGMCPKLPTICDCEKAKEELDLYKKLRDLYNAPLAESLIDKKVQIYRNKLLGIKEPIYAYATNVTPLEAYNPLTIDDSPSSIAIGTITLKG